MNQPMTTDNHLRQTLYEARNAGYHHCRVPSCCVSPGGVALAFVEARRHGRKGEAIAHNDYWDIDARLRRSSDGDHWSEVETIIDHADFGDGPIHNLVPISDPVAGCVHLLFCHDYRRLFITRSDDDGLSWSAPREIASIPGSITGDWTALAVGVGHGLCTAHGSSPGRLMAPIWIARSPNPNDPHRPSDLAWIVSDDHGVTWQLGDTLIKHRAAAADGRIIGTPNETSIAELGNGDVILNSRNESSALRRVQITGSDGGRHWSTGHFTEDLVDPQCHGSLLSIPDSQALHGTALVFANPATLEQTMIGARGTAYDRKRLTLRRSRDAGHSWQSITEIETGPSGYSDLASMPDGRVLCVFECGAHDTIYDTDTIAAELIVLPH